jgi:hypothetical protein
MSDNFLLSQYCAGYRGRNGQAQLDHRVSRDNLPLIDLAGTKT